MELKKKLKMLGVIATILIIIFVVLIIIAEKFNDTPDKENHVNPNEQIDVNETKFEKIAKDVNTYIVNKDYKSIYVLFTSDLKKQMTLKRFKNESKNILNNVGKFIKYADVLVTENEDYISSKSFIKYKESGVCVNLFLDTRGKIDGITLDYCTVPTSTEDYTENYVSIGKYSLHGLLTLPNDVKNPPVVILVQDINNVDMDSKIYKNKPFANIAHSLAKKGIAVLRFNKRFMQYSKLQNTAYTIEDSILDDVTSAVELMLKDNRIDKNNIYIAGHGLGGSLTPIIANNNPKIKGIISLAGSPRHYADILFDQYTCEIGASDKSDNTKLKELNDVKNSVSKIKKIKKDGDGHILLYSKSFWNSLNKLNIEKIVKKLDKPILILQGEDDFQTYAAVDYIKWQEILKDKENCSFKLYPGLNHYFMKSNGKDISEAKEEYNIKGTVDKDVISDIANWIKENSM